MRPADRRDSFCVETPEWPEGSRVRKPLLETSGQHLNWDIEILEDTLVPLQRGEIHQLGSAGIVTLDMDAAVGPPVGSNQAVNRA